MDLTWTFINAKHYAGSSALLVFTSEAEIYILSIPQLQVLAKFQVPFTPE